MIKCVCVRKTYENFLCLVVLTIERSRSVGCNFLHIHSFTFLGLYEDGNF
jgi:hypothetical protein